MEAAQPRFPPFSLVESSRSWQPVISTACSPENPDQWTQSAPAVDPHRTPGRKLCTLRDETVGPFRRSPRHRTDTPRVGLDRHRCSASYTSDSPSTRVTSPGQTRWTESFVRAFFRPLSRTRSRPRVRPPPGNRWFDMLTNVASVQEREAPPRSRSSDDDGVSGETRRSSTVVFSVVLCGLYQVRLWRRLSSRIYLESSVNRTPLNGLIPCSCTEHPLVTLRV